MQIEEKVLTKRIAEAVKGAYKGSFHKRHTERFLSTFANEVGCDFPSEEVIKSIYSLLIV